MLFNSPRLAKQEDYWRLSAHQDWRSSQGSLDSITIWMPMVDVDKSLGALEVIPGSHKWGLLESEKVSYYGKISETLPRSDFVPIEATQGDALFFSSFLVHRSGTNSTDSIRWSCHLRYNNLGEETFIQRGYPHPYIYKPQQELITPEFPKGGQVEKVFSSSDDEN
jgi:ectoine hydroxylase-related dioxygenase (phytanoyl-CoA dioxygenase family)